MLVCAIIFVYVTYGGMRSTAWVNTLQTSVFMIVGAVAFVVITRSHGGLSVAMTTIRESDPALTIVGRSLEVIRR